MSAKPRSAITTGGSPPRPFHRGLTVAGVVALFLLHASDGFVSDHATGDQRAYVGIAMKLERAGFGAYNLYHIGRVDFDGGVEYVWSQEREGELLEAYRSEGIGFYAQPVFHSPPLFAYLLSTSHRIFAPGLGYKVLFPKAASRMNLKDRLRVQFYSTAVPLLSGAVLVIATFLLGMMTCGYWTAIIAALLIAFSPAVVFSSERLWQDVPLAALVALAVGFLLLHLRSNQLGSLVLAAVSFALAVLTKNTAVLLAPTILIAIALGAYGRGGGSRRALGQTAFRAGLFFVLVLILTFPWYYTAYRTWGTPFYNAGEAGISRVHSWWIFAKSRPWYTYLVSIPAMVPLYILGYYRVAGVLKRRARATEVLLAIWFLSFLVALTVITHFSEQLGPDSRYMLPAYPPLAILAASQLLRLKDSVANRLPAAVVRWGVVGVILLCCAWCYRLSELDYAQFPRIYHNFMNMPF